MVRDVGRLSLTYEHGGRQGVQSPMPSRLPVLELSYGARRIVEGLSLMLSACPFLRGNAMKRMMIFLLVLPLGCCLPVGCCADGGIPDVEIGAVDPTPVVDIDSPLIGKVTVRALRITTTCSAPVVEPPE